MKWHINKMFIIIILLACLPIITEGNGTPLQYSCLENPIDGGAWWAAVHGVAKSRTRLKRLSSSSSSPGVGVGVPDCLVSCVLLQRGPGSVDAVRGSCPGSPL